METGICLHSIIPVRADPSHKSEMATQVLFGELYTVTGQETGWYKIRLSYDNYEGWIDILQSNLIDEHEFSRLTDSEVSITLDLVQLLSNENGKSLIPLVTGSSLPGLDKSRIRVGQEIFVYEGSVSDSRLHGSSKISHNNLNCKPQLIEDAMLYMNAPYLWGGRSPFGLDCSGFVQMVYKLQGLKLFRDASQQAAQGEIVSLLAEAEPGDLAFFDDPEGKITHVGMLIDHHRIIHCSGRVQIDSLDHEGIYNANMQKYTHKLRLIKRII